MLRKSYGPKETKQDYQSLRSSDGFKQRSPKSPLNVEEMAQSVVVSDVSRRQLLKESYDTSMSGSPKPMRQSSMLRSNSSVVTKKLTSNKNQHDKTLIKLLGLSMEAVCNKPGHDKNRVAFICKNLNCNAVSRLGCAHCFLQDHHDHSQDRLNVQEFCVNMDAQITKFRQLVSEIKEVGPQQQGLIRRVQAEFSGFREEINRKLQQLETSLMSQVEDRITQHDSWEALSQNVEILNRKTLFSMNLEEQHQAIDLLHDKQLKDLRRIKDGIFSHQSELENKITEAWSRFMGQIRRDFDYGFTDNKSIILPIRDRKEEAQSRIKQLENRRNRIEVEYMKHKLTLKELEQIEMENQLILQRQMEEADRLQRELERANHEAELRRQEAELQRKRQVEEEDRLNTLKRTFPYQLFDKPCRHTSSKCNTIPIFACCNRAYQCVTCHGMSHPPANTVPSLRYCMKCLEIYWAQYATCQPVNCVKCLK